MLLFVFFFLFLCVCVCECVCIHVCTCASMHYLLDTEIPLGFEQNSYEFSENAGILSNAIKILKRNNIRSEVNLTLNIELTDVTATEGVYLS